MRLLFLVGDWGDYLQDALFHGLVELLGVDGVREFPENPRYHRRRSDEDHLPMLVFDLPRHGRGLDDLLADADAVLIGPLGPDVLPAARHVLARARVPVGFVDGADDPYVRGIARHVDVYFKREVLRDGRPLRALSPVRRMYHAVRYPEQWRDPLRRQVHVATGRDAGIVPLPFGVVDTGLQPLPWEERDLDVVFLAGTTHPVRARVREELERLGRDGFAVESSEPRRWSEYLALLRRARLGVSVRGVGHDTYRYWEIPWTGAALLADEPQIVLPRNFVREREAFFAPAGELARSARRLLRSRGLAETAAAGTAAVHDRHLSVHRAATVIEHLERARRRRARADRRARAGRV